jgi:hypothetical protein
MQKTDYRAIGRPCPEFLAIWVLRRVHDVGPVQTAREIGVARSTLGSILGGLPIAASTESRVATARRGR